MKQRSVKKGKGFTVKTNKKTGEKTTQDLQSGLWVPHTTGQAFKDASYYVKNSILNKIPDIKTGITAIDTVTAPIQLGLNMAK